VRPLCTPQRTVWLTAAALALAACVAPPTTSSPLAARRQLDELTVTTSGSMSGYSRDRFPHWRSDGDRSCNVRDAVLRRDAQQVSVENGCNVVGGTWHSVYDGVLLTDPAKVDIDHVVPLANAWRSGAAGWDDTKRGDFANDVTRPELIAVSAASNRAKGDQDPAQWRPKNRGYWCQYALNWIAVKHHWRLTVTSAEKAALSEMLGTCPSSSAPQTSPPAPAG
jgi:hypothetical protein